MLMAKLITTPSAFRAVHFKPQFTMQFCLYLDTNCGKMKAQFTTQRKCVSFVFPEANGSYPQLPKSVSVRSLQSLSPVEEVDVETQWKTKRSVSSAVGSFWALR